jgi:glutamate carboxypeptidase
MMISVSGGMMNDYRPFLDWIAAEQGKMELRVAQWAAINSGSHNLPGLAQMAKVITQEFSALGSPVEQLALEPEKKISPDGLLISEALGTALHITKRPQAKRRIFLAIHMDTVYPPEHPFQQVQKLDEKKLHGPGVTDAKGGIAVMLTALMALERTSWAKNIGWEVLINPDEEIGSPGSGSIFNAAARRNNLGLVFEPALSNGNLVSARKGSGNFVLVVRGRSAHAGRDFAAGRNAIAALSDAIVQINAINGRWPEVTVNVAKVEGGGALNVVPDLAIVRMNIRCGEKQQQQQVREILDEITSAINQREGFSAQLHGDFHAPPRPLDEPLQRWLERAAECGQELGLNIHWEPSGGACDGNRLSAAGLSTIDTLGPVGGEIHSAKEYLLLDSLHQRAQLAALLLMKFAAGEYEG